MNSTLITDFEGLRKLGDEKVGALTRSLNGTGGGGAGGGKPSSASSMKNCIPLILFFITVSLFI